MNPTIRRALKTLPALYASDGNKADLPAVYLFTPDANATWVLWEYDEATDTAFGMADLGLGFPEMGSVWIGELESIRGTLGLSIEMDKSLNTQRKGYRNANVPILDHLEA